MGIYTSKYTGEQIDNLLGQVENGGNTTNGYEEHDLITTPADYILSGSSATTIAQDLVLNDDITNYDEIVFKVAYLCMGTQVQHPKENSIHVNNIVYNNSNTQIWDGSRISLISIALDIYGIGIWFKDTKTVRINNTFITTTALNDDKMRIISIKGIKY